MTLSGHGSFGFPHRLAGSLGFAVAMRGFVRMLGLLPLAAESWWCETSALTGCRGHPRHFVPEEAKGEVDKFKALFVSHRFSGWVVYWSSRDVTIQCTRSMGVMWTAGPCDTVQKLYMKGCRLLPSDCLLNIQR